MLCGLNFAFKRSGMAAEACNPLGSKDSISLHLLCQPEIYALLTSTVP